MLLWRVFGKFISGDVFVFFPGTSYCFSNTRCCKSISSLLRSGLCLKARHEPFPPCVVQSKQLIQTMQQKTWLATHFTHLFVNRKHLTYLCRGAIILITWTTNRKWYSAHICVYKIQKLWYYVCFFSPFYWLFNKLQGIIHFFFF